MRKPSRAMNVHLGADLKERWIAYCDALGKTPGAALKEAIEYQLANANVSTTLKIYRQNEQAKERKQRFEILLTETEKAAIAQRSQAERCSMRRWIVDAIRVGLTHEPQFAMSEIDQLGESNYQLITLARNLNQVPKSLNHGRYGPVTVERIDALRQLIDEHTSAVSRTIRASLERWSLG